MKQPLKILIGAFAIVGIAATGAMLSRPASAQSQEDNESEEQTTPMTAPVAKVTPIQAMKAAEAKIQGKAKMAIFEFDEGHWLYGVVLVKDGSLMEVDVDPVTGKAGDSEKVTPEDEAQEMKESFSNMIK